MNHTRSLRGLLWLLFLMLLAPMLPARGASSAVGTTGSITANAGLVFCPINEQGTASIEVTGTWVGTLQFECSGGGVTFTALRVIDPATDTTVTSTTGNGLWTAPVSGLGIVRVRASAWTSGTANIVLRASPGASAVRSTNVGSGGGGGGAVTVADGADVTQGATTDAAVGDATGSVNAHLRQIAKQLAATVAVTGTGNFAVTQVDGSSVTLGALADAAVGDATGTANGHLRQIAKLLAATLVVSGSGNFAVTAADGSSTTLGALADAAVGDASGSVNAHIRQVAKSLAGTLTVSGTVTANQGTQNGAGTASWNVQGAGAAGAALAGNPLLIGASDGTNAQTAKTVGAATGTSGTGLLGMGSLLWDAVGGANFVKAAGDGSGRTMVVGAVAAGAALAGNPVRVGVSNNLGNTSDLLQDNSSNLRVTVFGANSNAGAVAGNWGSTDGGNTGAAGLLVGAVGMDYNGTASSTGGDRHRNNTTTVVQASGVTTVQTINTDIVNYNGRAFMAHANVTLYNGGSILMKLQIKDANGLFVDIPGATTGTVTSGADLLLDVGPTVWPANSATMFNVNFFLPRNIRLVTVIATASVTFSESYDLPAS